MVLYILQSGGIDPSKQNLNCAVPMLILRTSFADHRLVVLICLLYSSIAHSLLCNGAIYGNPVVEDCIQALSWIPFAEAPHSLPGASALRIFAEPQQMSVPFAALPNNRRPRAIVQLPKIWKHSMLLHSLVISLVKLEKVC